MKCLIVFQQVGDVEIQIRCGIIVNETTPHQIPCDAEVINHGSTYGLQQLAKLILQSQLLKVPKRKM